jgi:hypothetical protein
MTHVYLVRDDGATEAMTRVRCENEDRELQRLLERNFDLLPGEQIDPDDPRRWLLVKREMPVPDPGTGGNRWNVDFLFLDQDAVPTFVECKRFEDTRSRREIVGQVLEYAANGRQYWNRDILARLADESAKLHSTDLAQALDLLRPNELSTAEAFFARAEENLRQGQVRIIFFLEESPLELRTVVDFLNGQMERSEVLLVEARQYSTGGRRVVVPSLLGYTEQARLIKRTMTDVSTSARRKWDKDSFLATAARSLDPPELQAVTQVLEAAIRIGCDIAWGTGKDTGSFNIKDPVLCQRSLVSVGTNGVLALNFGWLNESEREERVRDRLRDLAAERLGVSVPLDYSRRHLNLQPAQWCARAEALTRILVDLCAEFRGAA